MPFDDAMSMLAINFDQYVRDQKEKLTSVPVVPAPAPVAVPSREPPSFKPPDHHMHYLLNLLADKRYLNLEEIDQVLKYLQERRADIIAQRGGLATSSGKMADKEFLERKHAAPPAVDAYMSGGDNEMMNSNHQLSYGGASSNVSADHHTNYGGASSNMSEDHHVTYGGSSAMQHSPSSTVGDTSSQSIRALASSLDNPMVQAALNNLLASGPNLLQNLSAVGGPKASTPSSSAPSSSALASLSMAYDRASPPVEQSIGLSNRLSHHPMQQQSPVRTMRPAVSAAGSRPAGAPALRAPSSQQMAASGRPLSRSPAPNSSHTIRAHATNGPVRSIKPTTRPLW